MFSVPAFAGDAPDAFRSTPYPVPRFVSLGSDEVFVRSGPGSRYPVKWVYKKKGMPVEIVLEYEVWRKVKDVEGDTGWAHQSLISGKRTGLIRGEGEIYIRQKPDGGARKNALIEPMALVEVEECADAWCRVSVSGYRGWIERKNIWGVYKDEGFD